MKTNDAAAKVDQFKLAPEPYVPMGALMVVQIVEQVMSKGGVLFADVSRNKVGETRPSAEVPKAVVVAAGPQCRYVRRGDLVAWNGNAFKFECDGQGPYWSIQESQVIGVIKDEFGLAPKFRVIDWQTGEIERGERREFKEDELERAES